MYHNFSLLKLLLDAAIYAALLRVLPIWKWLLNENDWKYV